ncbi:MAG TPA: hypothetical protein VIY48_06015 [Candidatus Paceibacterota bacterium]
MKILPERVRADVNRRRSGAAGKHGDRRTKRNRDRSSQRRRAISEAKELSR